MEVKPTAKWRGWEYTNKYETHIVSSRNHLFVGGSERAVCGAQFPPGWYGAGFTAGDMCARCLRWAESHEGEFREVD